MKKSNKILLGGFLTIILILVAVHVALYARYKAGHYVAYDDKQSEKASGTKAFANAHHIDVRYFKNVTVVVGNQMKVETYGYDPNEIILTQQGNTVQMALKDSVSGNNVFGYMMVYVPENSLITAHDAHLRLASRAGEKITTLRFAVAGGRLDVMQSKDLMQVDSLHVDAANHAIIELHNARINKLSVRLNASELIDQLAEIQQLQLNADSASRINLQAKNFINLTTKTTAHE